MQRILARIDVTVYAAPVCDAAAWAAGKMGQPMQLLHVAQHKDAIAQRHDLAGVIGLGAKSALIEELTRIEAAVRIPRYGPAARASTRHATVDVHGGPRKSIVSHLQVVQNLVHSRRPSGENSRGMKEMEREFESRFPLQKSFPYKDLRGKPISAQGILRAFLLTLRRGTRVIGDALLPDGIVGPRYAVRKHHLDLLDFAGAAFLIRPRHIRVQPDAAQC